MPPAKAKTELIRWATAQSKMATKQRLCLVQPEAESSVSTFVYLCRRAYRTPQDAQRSAKLLLMGLDASTTERE